MNNFAAQGNSDFDWIFDSGASSHMSSSRNMLSSFTSSPFSSITLGDGSSIPISCVGQSHIPTNNKPLLLQDVLVAPALIKNLISVRKFTSDNLVCAEFDPFGLSVKDFLPRRRSHASIAPATSTPFMALPQTHHQPPWSPRLISGTGASVIQTMLLYRRFLVNLLFPVIEILITRPLVNPVNRASMCAYLLVLLAPPARFPLNYYIVIFGPHQ
jgi:hypothetical protein